MSVGEAAAPRRVALHAPSPNPSAGAINVSFELPRAGSIELGVYDVAGARVARLASGSTAAGAHTLRWEGRDDSGRAVRPGLYWLRLRTPGGAESRTVVIAR